MQRWAVADKVDWHGKRSITLFSIQCSLQKPRTTQTSLLGLITNGLFMCHIFVSIPRVTFGIYGIIQFTVSYKTTILLQEQHVHRDDIFPKITFRLLPTNLVVHLFCTNCAVTAEKWSIASGIEREITWGSQQQRIIVSLAWLDQWTREQWRRRGTTTTTSEGQL